MKKIVSVLALTVGMLPTIAMAEFKCPDPSCPKGNCVKCALGDPNCSDYCADNLRPVKIDNLSVRRDLTITIPDATPEIATKLRELLGGSTPH